MSKKPDIKIGPGVYRVQDRNVAFLYEREEDNFVFGVLNANKLTLEDLKSFHNLSGELLKLIEHEKH